MNEHKRNNKINPKNKTVKILNFKQSKSINNTI